VRVRQVAGHEDVLGPVLLDQVQRDLHVTRADLVLLHLPRLVERQVQEAGLLPTHPEGLDAGDRLRLADRLLQLLHRRNVHLPGLLPVQELFHLLDQRGPEPDSISKSRENATQEVQVAPDLVVEHRDVPRGLVRDQDVVPVLMQLVEDAAPRSRRRPGAARTR
jgi:hypothetical protein